MQLWQIGKEVIDNSIRLDFKEVRVFQPTLFQPSYNNHTATVLENAKGVSVLLSALNFITDSFQILLNVFPCCSAVSRFDARNILKDKHPGLIAFKKPSIQFVQIITRVLCHRNLHMTALRSSNKGVRLTWGTAYDNIYLGDTSDFHYSINGLKNRRQGFIRHRFIDYSFCY